MIIWSRWGFLVFLLVDAQGRTNTHQRVPAVDQQTGEQLWTRPHSSLFFIGLVIVVAMAVSVLAS